jgi:hypothetical protein
MGVYIVPEAYFKYKYQIKDNNAAIPEKFSTFFFF